MKKIKPIEGWADVGSHGGIFVLCVCGCQREGCQMNVGKFAIYETERYAREAGVKNPVKVKIINSLK